MDPKKPVLPGPSPQDSEREERIENNEPFDLDLDDPNDGMGNNDFDYAGGD